MCGKNNKYTHLWSNTHKYSYIIGRSMNTSFVYDPHIEYIFVLGMWYRNWIKYNNVYLFFLSPYVEDSICQ